MHPQHVLRLDGAGSAIRRLAAGVPGHPGLALAGCGDAATPSITTSPVSPTAAPTGSPAASIAPSPSASAPAVTPERIVVHRAGAVVANPPSELAGATARSFATGIAASEPTVAVLPDGSFAYQGWDRPPSGAEGTSHVHMAASAEGPWRDISPVPAGPTHDPYLAVDPRTGRVFSAALLVPGELEPDQFCIVVSFTDDLGVSWDTSAPVCDADADRPRLIASSPVTSDTGKASLISLCYVNARVNGQTCLRSTDGGRTFEPSGSIPADECDPGPAGPLFGHLATDDRGTLYLGRISCRRPVIAISLDEGVSWTEQVIGPEGWNGYPEVAVAVDADGVVYGVWVSTDRLPYLVWSRDGGATWSDPVAVGAPGVTEANLVVVEAGAGGQVAIGALVSTDAPAGVKPAVAVECRDGPCTDAIFYEDVTWHASLTMTADALAEAPLFVTAILNDPSEPIVRGACGPGRCKSNADFTDLTIDAQGKPWMAFVACPDGQCPTRPTGGWWGSSAGMLGTIDGVSLR